MQKIHVFTTEAIICAHSKRGAAAAFTANDFPQVNAHLRGCIYSYVHFCCVSATLTSQTGLSSKFNYIYHQFTAP